MISALEGSSPFSLARLSNFLMSAVIGDKLDFLGLGVASLSIFSLKVTFLGDGMIPDSSLIS
jgi:hypothetical protein